MSVPPQGGWQPGPNPPNQGQPYGQPFDPSAYNPQQQPPPPGWQQGSWAQQPGPPPPKGGGLKWLLIAVAVLLVVAVSIGATLLFTRDGGSGGSTPTSGAPSDIASANDTGPVSIITEEPTCEAFTKINNGLSQVQSNGWADQRATLGPVATWTTSQREQVEAVATAMKNASDQLVSLAAQTPHRVVRELYEQFIAYGRAYADSVSNYAPTNNELASTNVNASSALVGLCNVIDYGSANRSLTVDPVAPPTEARPPGNLADPSRFVTSADPACSSWVARESRAITDTTDWEKLDPNVPGSQWTPEQRATQEDALSIFKALADDMESEARQSNNPVLEDFGALAALYIRAYVSVGNSYTASDSWLSYTGLRLNNLVATACRAVAQ